MYTDNVQFTPDQWKAELQAVKAAGLTSLTLPYVFPLSSPYFNIPCCVFKLDGGVSRELADMLWFKCSMVLCTSTDTRSLYSREQAGMRVNFASC